MKRRAFLKQISGGILLASILPSFSCSQSPLRFGLVTDLHYAQKEPAINRYYKDSILKLRKAIETFNSSHLDFIIELGDLKDMGTTPNETEALHFLDEIEETLQSFSGPVYHVLGNHDMDCITKADFLKHTANPGGAKGKAFYSFEKKGIRFIVLDANYNEDRSSYNKGNFDWRKAFVPQEQLDWLEGELHEDSRPTIIFLHQMLDSFSDISKDLCVGNAEEVVAILERHPQVLAVFQGHHHDGFYSQRNAIHYFTMKGMIESTFPEHNSYAIVEIRPNGDIFLEGFDDCVNKEMKHIY